MSVAKVTCVFPYTASIRRSDIPTRIHKILHIKLILIGILIERSGCFS
jgi:hypothetical protein